MIWVMALSLLFNVLLGVLLVASCKVQIDEGNDYKQREQELMDELDELTNELNTKLQLKSDALMKLDACIAGLEPQAQAYIAIREVVNKCENP